MPDQDPEQPASSLSLPDLYYIVFRRKWIILGAFVLGLLAVVGVYFLSPPRFQSEAKLMVKYLLDNKTAAAMGGNADVRSLDVRSEAVIAAEMEVLRSFDLAVDVAKTVSSQSTASQIAGTNTARLPAYLNTNNLALAISRGLTVASPKGSTIILLNFESENSDVVQPVLRNLISAYFRKHNEIHRPKVDNLKIGVRKDELFKGLFKAETNLIGLKNKHGVISVEESRKAIAGQMSKLEQDIFTVETDLSERRALAAKFETSQSTNSASTNLTIGGTNLLAATTNRPIPAASNSVSAAGASSVSKDVIDEYQQLAGEIKALKNHLSELRTKYQDENPAVLAASQRLSDKEKRKAALELAQPALVNLGSLGNTNNSSVFEISSYKARLAALENRLAFLTNQLVLVKKRASDFENVSYEIIQAERQRDLAETNYYYLERVANQTSADKDLDASQAPNINVLQEPTVTGTASKTLIKRLAMAFAGCFGAGLALVLLLELVLDQTVKTSRQIESKLHLTTLMTIPILGGNGSSLPTTELPLLMAPSPDSNATPSDAATDPAAASKSAVDHPLRPYLEALRDRVGVRLENVPRKPKLVGVTNFDSGAGATSLATGLAATLSETGEGKVLYVDMNPQGHALHPFFHGKPATLDDLLSNASAKPDAEQKLHVVSALNEQGWGILPRKFSSLIPKLVASEYDYIIFDLPVFTPTSVTPMLARMLDTTLVVVEAEKTRREAVQKAGETLKQYKADFAVVLNKQPNYVPKWLHHEF